MMKVKNINFKEGKYWMPLLVYVLSLFVGYFVIDTFNLDIKDTGNANLKKGYRNIAVLKKMTFPNDKVLSISLSEKQISGRNISINLDYEDLLAADSFDSILLREQ